MTISLNDKVIENNGLSIGEVLLMIAIQNDIDFNDAEKSLREKGFISASYNKETHLPIGVFITPIGSNVLNNIILDSDKSIDSNSFNSRIETLVLELQSIYPSGKNFNNQHWRGNKTDIKRKLQAFFKRYGNDYSDEQIINATKAYVTSFNGDYKFMRLLQYFIWKEEIKDGSKILVSKLADYIENAGQEEKTGNDWTTLLR